MSDLDILDATLDDLDDLPSFEPFPAGHHAVRVSLETVEISARMKSPYVEMTLEAVSTVELVDPGEDKPIEQGDKCTTLFNLQNEFGLGNLKRLCAPLATSLGTESIRDCIEQAQGVDCEVVTAIKVDKNDPDKRYLNIKELVVL